MHLGMTGRFLVTQGGRTRVPGEFHAEAGGESAHDHVVFHLSNGARDHLQRRAPLRAYGPRAAGPSSTARRISATSASSRSATSCPARRSPACSRGKRAPLKAALLDQRLIAGLGNIYVCEALFRAGLHPEAPAGSLATADRQAAREGASPRRGDPRGADRGRRGRRLDAARLRADGRLARLFPAAFRVYDREGEPCATRGCGGTVRRLVQAGRSTFYCPRCQR